MKNLLVFISLIFVVNLSATIINIPADQPTIQAGIDASVDADTVLVQPGTYYENINFNGKNITVASLFLITQDSTYILNTIIDGNQNGSVVTFSNEEDPTAILQGFKIINGNGTEEDWSTVEPWFVRLGGGIYCKNSSPSLMNIIISDNIIQVDNNIQGFGVGIFSNNSSIHLMNAKISENNGFGQYVNGGGICFKDSSPILLDVTINNNSTNYGPGGGIYCIDSNLYFSDIIIINNSTDYGNGGGIYCKTSNLYFSDIIIINNSTNFNGQGGGIYCNGSFLQLQNATMSGNSAYSSGGGICCRSNSSLNVVNSTIFNNSAYGSGGGIFCLNSNSILENVILSNNSTDHSGGGIYCSSSSSNFKNVVISDNFATHNGGGFFCWYQSPSSLINVSICNNSTNYSNGGGISSLYSNTSLRNCILWNNSPQQIHGYPNVIYSDVQGGLYGIGNIDVEPLFVGTGEHPFTLQDLSPCVNAGIPDTTGLNLPEFDPAGNPRVFGGRIDMGAYENQNVVVGVEDNSIPLIIKLNQNYPNPFNPTTTIDFSIQNDSKIELSIYNIKGQRIKTLSHSEFTGGSHSLIWNGDDELGKSVSSGIYYYKLNVNGKTEAVKKCLLLK
ncbi:MAG: right-handed parallel beta-helix repeat-containing protein [Candidatus Cloacimonetes bacterium]|nr:right-handed parallel beta-helix repeat-containing protein [Candidatus Cloacimonadota bacterium]